MLGEKLLVLYTRWPRKTIIRFEIRPPTTSRSTGRAAKLLMVILLPALLFHHRLPVANLSSLFFFLSVTIDPFDPPELFLFFFSFHRLLFPPIKSRWPSIRRPALLQLYGELPCRRPSVEYYTQHQVPAAAQQQLLISRRFFIGFVCVVGSNLSIGNLVRLPVPFWPSPVRLSRRFTSRVICCPAARPLPTHNLFALSAAGPSDSDQITQR